MFEITADDISDLNDTDLRSLIALLCEAELRRHGHSIAAVTWGGSQTAKDGGLDVRVSLPLGAKIDGFVPRPQTGFQVKKPDMRRQEIINEMKPKPGAHVRPVLLELAQNEGAYIIVSSGASTSDSALKSRREAMEDGVKGSAAEAKLTTDFYDRSRIASWVREHAGLIPWVRTRIGKAVPGWQSHSQWSFSPTAAESYLADENARIRTCEKGDAHGLNAIDGLNRIRALLSSPGHVVRLIGLSGVGKTRFAEALFDPSIGVNALDPSLAIYTNVGDEPTPPPPQHSVRHDCFSNARHSRDR